MASKKLPGAPTVPARRTPTPDDLRRIADVIEQGLHKSGDLAGDLRRNPQFIAATQAAARDAGKLLSSESDRGCVLVGAAMLHEILAALIRAFLIEDRGAARDLFDSAGAPLHSFSACIRVSRAIGLVEAEVAGDLHRIREIRNAAAHFDKRRGAGFATGFTSPSVRALCEALVKGGQADASPRKRFERAVGYLSGNLEERALAGKFIADNLGRAAAASMFFSISKSDLNK